MENIIISVILIIIIGLAVFYIYKEKKSGKKCIGCPNSCKSCEGACHCNDK